MKGRDEQTRQAKRREGKRRASKRRAGTRKTRDDWTSSKRERTGLVALDFEFSCSLWRVAKRREQKISDEKRREVERERDVYTYILTEGRDREIIIDCRQRERQEETTEFVL